MNSIKIHDYKTLNNFYCRSLIPLSNGFLIIFFEIYQHVTFIVHLLEIQKLLVVNYLQI